MPSAKPPGNIRRRDDAVPPREMSSGLTPWEGSPSFVALTNSMAENTPNIPAGPGGVPPKPAEAPKAQTKKETVRISLPPKPTSAPTIKLPTIPAGGVPAPAAPSVSVPSATPAPAAPSAAAPAPPRPPTTAPSLTTSRPPSSTGTARPAGATAPAATTAPAPAPRPTPAPAPAAKKVGGLDVGLSIAAAVIGLAAVGSVLLLLNLK